jgi:hypothetical protein
VGHESFDPARLRGLPEPAERYLRHAIVVGTPLFSAVRLEMHGTIRLRNDWLPFRATQVNCWERGYVWRADVRLMHLPILGSDCWFGGQGTMRWKLFGLLPFMTAKGPDITRSAAGRLNVEGLCVPTAWLGCDVRWLEGAPPQHAHALIQAHGVESKLELGLSAHGALESVVMSRWGNPTNSGFHEAAFGGLLGDERCFQGVTIPTSFRLGWFPGTSRFNQPGGEFFRATVDRVEFR